MLQSLFDLLFSPSVKMSTKILSVAILLLSVCVCFESFASAHPGRHPGKSRMCCVDVTKADISSDVTGNTYREQRAKDPCVAAVIFNTNNTPVCADPKAHWVKKLIANMTKV